MSLRVIRALPVGRCQKSCSRLEITSSLSAFNNFDLSGSSNDEAPPAVNSHRAILKQIRLNNLESLGQVSVFFAKQNYSILYPNISHHLEFPGLSSFPKGRNPRSLINPGPDVKIRHHKYCRPSFQLALIAFRID